MRGLFPKGSPAEGRWRQQILHWALEIFCEMGFSPLIDEEMESHPTAQGHPAGRD